MPNSKNVTVNLNQAQFKVIFQNVCSSVNLTFEDETNDLESNPSNPTFKYMELRNTLYEQTKNLEILSLHKSNIGNDNPTDYTHVGIMWHEKELEGNCISINLDESGVNDLIESLVTELTEKN